MFGHENGVTHDELIKLEPRLLLVHPYVDSYLKRHKNIETNIMQSKTLFTEKVMIMLHYSIHFSVKIATSYCAYHCT